MRLSSLAAILFLAATTALAQPKTIDWVELIPEDQRSGFDPAPPPPAHDYLSGEGGLAAQQLMDFRVNAKLDGQQVKLPGFIVPLELDVKGLVTEFFLVPYFGACIHVPPPPPNQLVYVKMDKGISLDSMYSAYWITGTMSTKRRDTTLGAAAYTLAGTLAEEYKF
jgi:hypothetical protein